MKKLLSTVLALVILGVLSASAFAADFESNFNDTEEINAAVISEFQEVMPLSELTHTFRFTGALWLGTIPARTALLTADRASDWKQLTFHKRTFHNTTKTTISIPEPLPGGSAINKNDSQAYCYTTNERKQARPARVYVTGLSSNYM